MTTTPAAAATCNWYFAYGSNMQRATFRQRRGLEPADVRVGRLDGYALCFDLPVGPGRRGVANLVRREGDCVWGVLYHLTPEQHERLDRSEGVHNGLYVREAVNVEVVGGQMLAAEAFISEHRDASRGPSLRYLTILVEGAREHGLAPQYVARLEQWPVVWDEREGAANPPGMVSPPGVASDRSI